MSLLLMGKKKGMMRLFNEQGNAVVCSVIEAEPNVVCQVKTLEKDGYPALQLGAFKVSQPKVKNVSKPLRGHFARCKVEPRKYLRESRLDKGATVDLGEGQEVGVTFFADCTHVDVTGTSKGKGFQGVIKRHHFSGGPASHGSGFHRSAGSTGMRSTPGRCLPGTKMPGRMGNEKVTIQNLKIVKIDEEKNVLIVEGAIPGPCGGLVFVSKAVKMA